MIIRILSEGQFDVPDGAIDELNQRDAELEAALDAADESALTDALGALLAQVRAVGNPVPIDSLVASDLVLPHPDATLGEVRDLVSGDGLIPG